MGISKQLKDINILEIGTHHGNSSIALAYGNLFGNNIKIDTYDITDPKIKELLKKYNRYLKKMQTELKIIPN